MLAFREPGPKRMNPAADPVPRLEDDDRRALGFEVARRGETGKPGSEHDDLRAVQRTRWTRFPRHSRSIHGGNMSSARTIAMSFTLLLRVVERLRHGPRAGGAHIARWRSKSELRKAIAASGAEVSVALRTARRTGRSPDRSGSVVSRREHDESAGDDRVVPTGSRGHARVSTIRSPSATSSTASSTAARTRSATATTRTRRSTRRSAERCTLRAALRGDDHGRAATSPRIS